MNEVVFELTQIVTHVRIVLDMSFKPELTKQLLPTLDMLAAMS